MKGYRSMKPAPCGKSAGFSLVEMAMVLMIIGLLLGGLLPTLSNQMETRQIAETRKEMADIREVLTGFMLINGRLPCPAQATIPTGSNNAGTEATVGTACSCKGASGNDNMIAWASGVACTDTSITGVLPWVTLGTGETDAWGRRFTYRISTDFADLNSAPSATFTLSSTGVQKVYQNTADAAADINKVTTPAVFISHGKNGYGAYQQQGKKLLLPDPTPPEELENSDDDNKFISQDYSTNFDDIVSWLSQNMLVSRMISAGKLP